MKTTLQDEIDEVFLRLSGSPPTAEQQAMLLTDALSAVMAKSPVMRIEKIDERFVKITGAGSKLPKTISGHMGRAGEVVIYDSLIKFMNDPLMEQKWGGTAIYITAEVLIPIDIRSREALERSALSTVQKQAVLKARGSWVSTVHTESIADFMITNAYPIESKTRWETKLYVSETGEEKEVRTDKKMFAKNPYISKLAQSGGKTVVGAITFDVIFEDIFREQTKKIKRQLKQMKSEFTKSAGKLVETRVHGDETVFFKIVSLRINAFVPAVIDDKNFKQWIKGQVVDPSDNMANMVVSEFTTEVMDRIRQSYKQSR